MTEQMRASELLFDEAELARRARTTLAGADSGVLMIADGQAPRLRECEVTVTDDCGEALLASPVAGPVAQAATRRAHAALLLRPNEQYGVGLTLIGRISPAAPAPNATHAHTALSVERVLASCPHPGIDYPGPHREIPLSTYAAAEPDPVAAGAWRVARHLTGEHQLQLRGFIAHLLRRPLAELAAVQVARLTGRGVELWWVDTEGAHCRQLRFPRPARDLTDLGCLLRDVLSHPR